MLTRLTKCKLALHPQYPRILQLYNDEFQKTNGDVNNLKFYREIILPVYPKFGVQSWYQFLRRYRTVTGLVAAQALNTATLPIKGEEEQKLATGLLSNEVATQSGIQSALNVGAKYFKLLLERFEKKPESLSAHEQRILSTALFNAMKAQDSRMHAIGKLREDGREQAKFDRAFNNAASGQ